MKKGKYNCGLMGSSRVLLGSLRVSNPRPCRFTDREVVLQKLFDELNVRPILSMTIIEETYRKDMIENIWVIVYSTPVANIKVDERGRIRKKRKKSKRFHLLTLSFT